MDTSSSPQSTDHAFRFTGSGGEYFKIWIVNIVLSILTLGIYSAWAKVRTLRYFYGNTILADAPFEYHGRPLAILKGRLLAVLVLLIYFATVKLAPVLAPLFILLFAVAFPWIVVNALRFRLRNTSYRNIHGDFHGGVGRAAAVYIGGYLLTLITLGLYAPYFIYKIKTYLIGNMSFGATRLEFTARGGQFYKVFGLALLGLIVIIALGTFGMGIARSAPELARPAAVLIPLLLVATYFWFGAYLYTQISNLTWNHTSAPELQFHSHLTTGRVYWLYFSSLVAILLSLGLLIPWATVRMLRYRIETLSLAAAGGLDTLIGAEQPPVGAVGEGMTDLIDMDIGM